jgi:AraC-like DNA-binding protein
MDSTTFGVIGAVYAAAFGAGLLRLRRHTTADTLLSLLCGIAATAIVTIVAQHDGRLSAIEWQLERVELAASLLAGPLLFFYVRAALLQHAPRRTEWLQAIPAALAIFIEPPIEVVVLHQVAYTLAATWRGRHGLQPAPRLLLAFFWAVHVAQAARFVWSDVGTLQNVVPVVASAAILLIGIALALLAMRAKPAPYRKSSLAESGATRCVERLDELMRTEGAYRDTAASLATLATRLGVTTHHLSQSLNQHRGTTLTDYLAVWRVEEAKRQLLDPARDAVTIDAIAESSGFGSRSAFYNAFKRIEGVTPREMRKRRET